MLQNTDSDKKRRPTNNCFPGSAHHDSRSPAAVAGHRPVLRDFKPAAALGLEKPASPQLSVLLQDVLNSMGLSFSYEQCSEDAEYLYPNLGLVTDLWKDGLGLRKELLSALEQFFRRKGLYGEDGRAVRVPRRFTTCMKEISI